ncbi:MAG: proteasome assembly chaperone family protein [Promethearchaeota archaeon]
MVIEIILLEKNVNLKGKYMITGFHGIGVVGYIATKYLIEETKAKKIGIVVSDHMAPIVSLNEDGELQTPVELFLDENNNFIYLLVRFSPHPSELRDFIISLSDFIEKNEISGLILLGGLDKNFRPADDDIGFRCVISNNFSIEPLQLEKAPLIDANLFISGGIAMFLIELKRRRVPTLVLFPYADRENPDMKAASKAIEIINKLFNTSIGTENLMDEAKEIEKEVDQLLSQQKKENTNNFYM